LHGSNSNEIPTEESGPNGDLDSSLKHDGDHLAMGGEAGGVDLNFSSSLQFIEDELGGASPSGAELGEEQPFDILQKSLLEADITEQTLAQEALLESTPVPAVFPQQVVSGAGFEGVAAAGIPFSGTQPQGFLQQSLQNGSSVGHIQVLGSFSGAPSVMTATSMLVQRPAGQVSASGQGSVFNPTPGGAQVPVPLSGCGAPIPLQNIIIQRGPTPQALVRPIQPKPLSVGGQTVYSLGVQIPTAAGSPQSTQQVKVVSHSGSIVIHPSLGQQPQQQQQQSSLSAGQFILPTSISLTSDPSGHSLQALNGPVLQTAQPAQPVVTAEDTTTSTTYSILTNHSAAATVQLVAGQGFATGGHLIVNQGIVSSQVGQSAPALLQVSGTPGTTAKAWVGLSSSTSAIPTPSPVQLNPQNRPAIQQLTKGDLVLQQLHEDRVRVLSANRSPFSSWEDAFLRLLPFHVFQGALPTDADFVKVDQEFEAVATDVLKRTQAMLSKYRRLLLAEAERTSPSSEIVMIARTFNQEERRELTQDKRMALVDPEGFLEDFCCVVKPAEASCVGGAHLSAGCHSDTSGLAIDGYRTEAAGDQGSEVDPHSAAIGINPDVKNCQRPVAITLKKYCSCASWVAVSLCRFSVTDRQMLREHRYCDLIRCVILDEPSDFAVSVQDFSKVEIAVLSVVYCFGEKPPNCKISKC
uniref:BICRA like chromatin remodeling complex associated protein n=1 Tax=Scleropages formosus TaxID=113540 RepID=A0A8C9UZY7_SCLFO